MHYDNFTNRWNMMVGSATPERWIRYYIDDAVYALMTQLQARIPPGTGTELSAPTALWDGAWHQLRGHYKMGDGTGALEAWIDGVKVFDETGLRSEDTQDGGNGYFSFVYLSSLINHRPDQLQSILFGRYRVYIVNPGW